MRSGPRIRIATWTAALALLATGCLNDPGASVGQPEVAGTEATTGLGGFPGPVVVATGDIACAPGSPATDATCQQAATARLALNYDPRRVLTLGDQQYDAGRLADFRGSYADSWGRLKPLTKPVPGNHEYRTAGASGYYTYFRRQQPGAPGYHAFDVGSWRVYALNTNCTEIDCARQRRWLDRRMTRSPHRCTAITMHHPRFSSGSHGSNVFVRPLWRTAMRHGADVALGGHDHHYERFRRLNASGGGSRRGIASFVSGAGGRSLYAMGDVVSGSAVRHNSTFGVLALRLGRGRYAWEYRTVDGDVVDAGTRRCTR